MLASEGSLEPFHEILKMTNVQATPMIFSAEDTERWKKFMIIFFLYVSSFPFLFLRKGKWNPFA
jgi:hypothetical protein